MKRHSKLSNNKQRISKKRMNNTKNSKINLKLRKNGKQSRLIPNRFAFQKGGELETLKRSTQERLDTATQFSKTLNEFVNKFRGGIAVDRRAESLFKLLNSQFDNLLVRYNEICVNNQEPITTHALLDADQLGSRGRQLQTKLGMYIDDVNHLLTDIQLALTTNNTEAIPTLQNRYDQMCIPFSQPPQPHQAPETANYAFIMKRLQEKKNGESLAGYSQEPVMTHSEQRLAGYSQEPVKRKYQPRPDDSHKWDELENIITQHYDEFDAIYMSILEQHSSITLNSNPSFEPLVDFINSHAKFKWTLDEFLNDKVQQFISDIYYNVAKQRELGAYSPASPQSPSAYSPTYPQSP